MESYMMILCVLLLYSFIPHGPDSVVVSCVRPLLCLLDYTYAYYTFESITYEKETENIIYMPSIQLKRRQIKKARSMPHQSHWTCRRRCIYCSVDGLQAKTKQKKERKKNIQWQFLPSMQSFILVQYRIIFVSWREKRQGMHQKGGWMMHQQLPLLHVHIDDLQVAIPSPVGTGNIT